MRLVVLSPLLVSLCVVVSGPAVANDIELKIDNRAAPGKQPQLTVVVNKDVESVTLDVSSGKSRVQQKKGPQTQPGKIEFTLKQEGIGTLKWNGTLNVVFADGSSGEMPLSFQTERLSTKFKFSIAKEGLDLANDKLKLVSERPTAKVEIEIYTDEDDLLASGGQDYAPPIPPGSPVEVSWLPKKKGDVLRIHTIVYDENGSFQSSDSFPYSITIPHEDVVFDTGKSLIRPEQEPKLMAVVPEIEKALKRFGPAMKAAGTTVKLFVQGHTDTVGDPGSNRALSQNRALAIAKWFKAHGVTVAVYARGFGEDMLKVMTPDNTAEEGNRRAEYDVGVDGPTGSTSGWARVE